MSAEAAKTQLDTVVLACDVGGARVAFSLSEVETTLPLKGLAPLCRGSAPFTGITTHMGRAIAVLAPENLPSARPPSFTTRLVTFKNGLAVTVDDLHGLEPADPSTAPLSLAETGEAMAAPQGSLPAQVYLFRFAETDLSLRLEALHHVRLIAPSQLSYSADLASWEVGDAPGVPVYAAFGPSSAGEPPILGDLAHVLFVTMADGSNFGLILNEGRLEDPGAPSDAQVFEIPAPAAQATCSEAVIRLENGAHRCLVSPDLLFARCHGFSGASAGRSEDAA